MNELFFSAMFIGSILFGNPETTEIPSELNMNNVEYAQANPSGTISLISSSAMKLRFKVTGDQVDSPLDIYVNDESQGSVNVNEEFEIKRPVNNGGQQSIEVILKNADSIYASYVISF